MQEVFEQFRRTRLLVLQDDSSDDGRSILVAPAAAVDPDLINHVLSLTGGLPFVAVSAARSAAFALERMGRSRTTATAAGTLEGASGCISVEAREGVTTGISAADRAATIRILGAEAPQSRALVRPGHVFPVEVRAGGVLVRNALPEGALDVVTIAGFSDAALYLDLLDTNGEFQSADAAGRLAEREHVPLLSLAQLTRYRLENEKLVTRIAEARLPTTLAGEVRSVVYRSSVHDGEHIALVKGIIDPKLPTLTRVQPEFTFADVFGGDSPPTRMQLRHSLAAIGAHGSGVLIYLRRPLSGQLTAQVRAWKTAFTAQPAVLMREYGLGAQILRDLGVRKIELLTGGRKDLAGLDAFGLEIVGQRPIPTEI